MVKRGSRPLVACIIVLFLLAVFSLSGAYARKDIAEKSFVVEREEISRVPGFSIYAPGEVIVKYKVVPKITPDKSILFSNLERVVQDTDSDLSRVYKITLNEGESVLEKARGLEKDPNVEYAEPNYLYRASYVPNDGSYSYQWAHQNTQAELGWDIQTGNESVIIAIVDTGVDYEHEDLEDNMMGNCTGGCLGYDGYDYVHINTYEYEQAGFSFFPGEDYIYPDTDPMDYHGHGTHCAGIAAAVTGNGLGVAGACPNCKIMPLRAGFSIMYPDCPGGCGLFESDDIANAINYAANRGANIISMSFGGGYSSLINNAINNAKNRGVYMVAAAGNEDTSVLSYPAAYEGVLSISATDRYDRPASFSNYGDWVDVAAPGVSIYSTVPKIGTLGSSTGYRYLSGTSMSAPYVAGLLGLMISEYPTWTVEKTVETLLRKVDPIVYFGGNDYGSGRVNVYKAVQSDTYCITEDWGIVNHGECVGYDYCNDGLFYDQCSVCGCPGEALCKEEKCVYEPVFRLSDGGVF